VKTRWVEAKKGSLSVSGYEDDTTFTFGSTSLFSGMGRRMIICF